MLPLNELLPPIFHDKKFDYIPQADRDELIGAIKTALAPQSALIGEVQERHAELVASVLGLVEVDPDRFKREDMTIDTVIETAKDMCEQLVAYEIALSSDDEKVDPTNSIPFPTQATAPTPVPATPDSTDPA